jgi:hypothetical protein
MIIRALVIDGSLCAGNSVERIVGKRWESQIHRRSSAGIGIP